jgi:hypothetical protein
MAVPDPQGWKEFGVNEVVTSAHLQGYVMQQIIAVFADATARDAAITEPKEGQYAHLKGTDTLTRYDGAAWVASVALNAAAQDFVEGGEYKAFHALGSPSPGTPAGSTYIGMGFQVRASGSPGTVSPESDAGLRGAWRHSTGATSTSDAGFQSGGMTASEDWTLVWRGVIPNEADRTVFIGRKSTGNFQDNNDLIAFRVDGTGNVVGVCDNGGTETTRDTGANGATELTLRIEVREGGTVVRFFKNGVQVGADVTTNIPTGALGAACGIANSTTADKRMQTYDLFGWREA